MVPLPALRHEQGGLEDSIYLGAGTLAKSNAEQVSKARRMVEDIGPEIATPGQARAILGLGR